MSIRHAAVAGQFYPGHAATLRADVTRYIRESGVEPAPDRTAGIIAPHAGYMYSGPTAGFVFARIQGKQSTRAVILGRSHRYPFEGASVYAGDAFETPLGLAKVDVDFARTLAEECGGMPDTPHHAEHALEVQVPFLQVAMPDTPIVPVLFGSDPDEWHIRLGERLAAMLDPSDLVVASTDLSHFLSEARANAIDRHTIDVILGQDCRAACAGVADDTCSMCGGTAVVTAMACALAMGANDWRLLDYRTSGAASGDYHRVVGYAAISMERVA